MNEIFVKPKRVVVNALEYLSEALEEGLQKDLQENQILCPKCKGTGLIIDDRVYGLSDDPNKTQGHFPYHTQYIASCDHCFAGVVNLCEYCGKQLPRFHLRCDCDKAEEARRTIEREEEKKRMSNAKILKYDDEIAQSMGMLYSDDYGENEGYFTEWEEFFEYIYDECEANCRPKYVWGTTSYSFYLDTDNILESVCDDLHEDARDNLIDVDELMMFHESWSKKQTGAETYCQSYKYLIEIPWED